MVNLPEAASGAPHIARVILYVQDVLRVAAFYERFFGMRNLPGGTDKWTELSSGDGGGCNIALHNAAKSQKSGAAMKIAFGVKDVHGFKAAAERKGLKFGVVHEVEGFAFANAKDPAGNSIQISSRGLI
jgi:predicted enzyme related to lactoylglutathione lyase